MCYPMVIMAVAAAVSAYSSVQQGKMAAATGRYNQQMGEIAAQDAIRRGEENAMAVRRRGDQVRGAQRASMAAKGLDLGDGTAAELQDQTDFFSQTDQATARSNARHEAWSDRAAGRFYNAQGQASQSQANLSAFSTVMNTAGQVSGKWYTPSSSGYNYNGDSGGLNYSSSGADIRGRR